MCPISAAMYPGTPPCNKLWSAAALRESYFNGPVWSSRDPSVMASDHFAVELTFCDRFKGNIFQLRVQLEKCRSNKNSASCEDEEAAKTATRCVPTSYWLDRRVLYLELHRTSPDHF